MCAWNPELGNRDWQILRIYSLASLPSGSVRDPCLKKIRPRVTEKHTCHPLFKKGGKRNGKINKYKHPVTCSGYWQIGGTDVNSWDPACFCTKTIGEVSEKTLKLNWSYRMSKNTPSWQVKESFWVKETQVQWGITKITRNKIFENWAWDLEVTI